MDIASLILGRNIVDDEETVTWFEYDPVTNSDVCVSVCPACFNVHHVPYAQGRTLSMQCCSDVVMEFTFA